MNTAKLFEKKRVLSFEIFPPKGKSNIYDIIYKLSHLKPDYISVTCGAGASKSDKDSIKIASDIKNTYGIESVAHLPGIHLSKEDVIDKIAEFKKKGIKNILALRGDINPDYDKKNDFRYASDLIKFIKENGEFNIIGACYPEGHLESNSIIEDIKNLKTKVDAGTSQLITQVFFDNKYFYSFLDKVKAQDIDVPIQAGIMPIISKKQIERIVSLSGINLPKEFISLINKYENNHKAMIDAGIEYAVKQIGDLIDNGVHGIHLYTMNNPYIANRIFEEINQLLAA